MAFKKPLSRLARSRICSARAPPANPSPPPPAPPLGQTQVKVALCQLHVTADKAANIQAARAAVAGAAAAGARLVVLPEMWNCPYSNDSFPTYAEDFAAAAEGGAPSYSALSEAAAAARVTLVGGSVPERAGGKLYNTCCVFGPNGGLLAKHRWGWGAGRQQ
jgi:omega-amidase